MNDHDTALLFAGLARIERRQAAIEQKLDALLTALAADEEPDEQPRTDLDGQRVERQQESHQSLD